MIAVLERARAIKHGQRLEYFTIVWNSFEALVALVSGFVAGSVALVGFGLDSLIEVTSGGTLLWRLHYGEQERQRERVEQKALRIVGLCFVALALYIAYDSAHNLLLREAPERSIPGILIAAASLIVMPVLAAAKRRVANTLESAAMNADARQTEFCTYLSAILLGGLLLNALFGLWWADPLAGLVMVPIIGKEGWDALHGKNCCGGGGCNA
jgi:divalent metal cation (Fe/Co/Zn/Cd) transporter